MSVIAPCKLNCGEILFFAADNVVDTKAPTAKTAGNDEVIELGDLFTTFEIDFCPPGKFDIPLANADTPPNAAVS